MLDVNGRIRIIIPSSGRKLALELTSPVWIGRSDAEAGFWPRLDLTADNGVALGVSRRHAVIEKQNAGVMLIDKNSANGTWLAQKQLQAERPYSLPREAEVRFGKLLVKIFLE